MQLVMILGITQRSGTHFLHELLLRHEQCIGLTAALDEDYLLDMAAPLITFEQRLVRKWPPEYRVHEHPELLMRSLGDGLTTFLLRLLEATSESAAPLADLEDGRERVLVTKSPSVWHLDQTFRLFPDARVLLLVREPQAVVESGMSGLGWSFERALTGWAAGARIIRDVRNSESWRPDQVMLVRYEDLVSDADTELKRIFHFLDLSISDYDFDAPDNLPVVGSSFFPVSGRGKDLWSSPVVRNENFKPLERRMVWSKRMLTRLGWTCGPYVDQFGYRLDDTSVRGSVALYHHFRGFMSSAQRVTRVTGRQTLDGVRARTGGAGWPRRPSTGQSGK
jgi:hypothetical protein